MNHRGSKDMHETLKNCKCEHYFRYAITDIMNESMIDISGFTFGIKMVPLSSITKWLDDEDYEDNCLRSAKRHAFDNIFIYFSVHRPDIIYNISLAYLPIRRGVIRTMMLRL